MHTILNGGILRWDTNIKQLPAIGLVGAGGICMVLTSSMNLFNWHHVSLILLFVFAVVLAGEFISAALRKKIV